MLHMMDTAEPAGDFTIPRTMTPDELGDTLARLVWENFTDFLSDGDAEVPLQALGAGPAADAFYAAFRFPNLFRRLFAEGAFNTAFVPMFSGALEQQGREQALEAYERGLGQLPVHQREAVILRVEFDMSYAEIAAELECPSSDAARMQVARGLRRLAELMP